MMDLLDRIGEEAIIELKATVITPGGRVGNNAKHGSSANGQNWIERLGADLPEYIRTVRNGIMKQGHDESGATRLAIGAMKRWASGASNVSAPVRAAAAKALAQWEALKARAHGSKALDWINWLEYKQVNPDNPENPVIGNKPKPKKHKPKPKVGSSSSTHSSSGSGTNDFNNKHPRSAAGTSKGGKFTKKGSGSGSATPKGQQTITINRGDTLSALAVKYHCTVDDLMKMNPYIKDKNLIYTGKKLQVPGKGTPAGDPKGGGHDTSGKPIKKKSLDEDMETKKTYTAAQRKEAAKKGEALPDGSFIIKDKTDLKNAIGLRNNGGSSQEVIYGHIRKRAQALGATHMLPDDMKQQKKDSHAEPSDPDMLPGEPASEGLQEKEDDMPKIEYKEVGVTGFNVVDEQEGIVETFVSITGLKDNVKDVIHPGSFEKSLATRTPKGVWSHQWDTPVSKALEVKEYMPGDAGLPETLSTGAPWPTGAGALKIKTQFNLDTQRGKEAFSDVVFFGDQQEWSIGYQVPVGGATMDSKSGVRNIHALELYEYSPVLFGAMPEARTSSVKDAQVAFKMITMPAVEFKEWCDDLGIETKDIGFGEMETKDGKPEKGAQDGPDNEGDPDEGGDAEDNGDSIFDEDDPDAEGDDPNAEEEDPNDNKNQHKSLRAFERETLEETVIAIGEALGVQYKVIDPNEDDGGDDVEEKDLDIDTDDGSLTSVIQTKEAVLVDNYEPLLDSAGSFDEAVEAGDQDGMDEHGGAILDVIDDEDADGDLLDAYQDIAGTIARLADEGVPDGEEDPEEEKAFPARPGKEDVDGLESKDGFVKIDTKQLDLLRKGLLPQTR